MLSSLTANPSIGPSNPYWLEKEQDGRRHRSDLKHTLASLKIKDFLKLCQWGTGERKVNGHFSKGWWFAKGVPKTAVSLSLISTPIANVWSESKIYHHFSSINNFGISQTFPRKNLTAEAPYLGPVITTLVTRLLLSLTMKIPFSKNFGYLGHGIAKVV